MQPYDTPLLSGGGVGQGRPASAGDAAGGGAALLRRGQRRDELGGGQPGSAQGPADQLGADQLGAGQLGAASMGPISTTLTANCSMRLVSGRRQERGQETGHAAVLVAAGNVTRPALPSADPSSSR